MKQLDFVEEILTAARNNTLTTLEYPAERIPPNRSDNQHHDYINKWKQAADHFRMDNIQKALALSEYMLFFSRHIDDAYCEGISHMALANCSISRGNYDNAWEELNLAAACFEACQHVIGWGRTCISRLLVCANVEKVEVVLADVDRARRIFTECQEYDYLTRLEVNLAWLHNLIGKYEAALAYIGNAIDLAEQYPELLDHYRGQMLLIRAYSFGQLGRIQAAIDTYTSAAQAAQVHEQSVIESHAQSSASYYMLLQGQYRKALRQLYELQGLTSPEEQPVEHMNTQLVIFQAYQELNRYADITQQIPAVMANLKTLSAKLLEGRAHRYFGIAHIYLDRVAEALEMLNKAVEFFQSLQNQDEVRVTQYWIARTLFQLGNYEDAQTTLSAWLQDTREESNRLEYEQARLLQACLFLRLGELDKALEMSQAVRHDAQRQGLTLLEYQAMQLIGAIFESQGRSQRAVAHYEQALNLIETSHQHLTVGLYPNFFRDKVDVLRALIRIYHQTGQFERAYQTLVRGRAQALAQYIEQQDTLLWNIHTAKGEKLLADRKEAISRYNLLFRQVYYPTTLSDDMPKLPTGDAQLDLKQLERQIVDLTEQLQLHTTDALMLNSQSPTLADVQRPLPQNAVLLQYYVGSHAWSVFVIRHDSLHIVELTTAADELLQKITEIRTNIDFSVTMPPESPVQATLKAQLLPDLQDLYQRLVSPVQNYIRPNDQLYIVPFSDLHQLPFSMLHDGQQYLVEKHEIILLPSATSLLRPTPSPTEDVVILGHSWDGNLPQCITEAQAVHNRMGGKVFLEEAATQVCFERPGGSILHIAAHGQFRADRPELSHIWLGDGQLLLDDLLQYDLRYQLIVLTACETGRGRVSGIDELIGVGRGFLLKGAQALLLSLWQIHDATTPEIVRCFYDHMLAGQRKTQALQTAQQTFLSEHPTYHPAFWGAFQLVGNPSPL